MFFILFRIVGYWMMKYLGFPRLKPMNYTVSLLYSCNSRCSTCRVWKKKANNLTLHEYKKIFRSIGRSPYWITFSGGEPFLRNDLVEVVSAIYKISRPAIINIPTNGILSNAVVEKSKAIALACPKAQVIINVSIDGIESQHDEIRNVPGNYKKAVNSFNKLKALQIPNLSVGIHTVISRFNVDSFSSIANGLMRLNPDSYITEIAEERVELDTIGLDITPGKVAYKSAIDYLIHKIKNGKYRGMSKITMAFRIEYYNLVKEIMRDERQAIPCYSSVASCQISPDGEIWSCCVKAKSLGNLRDNGYKFRKIWWGKKAKKERKSIHRKECWCPLANAAYTNMLLHLPTLFRVSYRSFIRWWS